MVYIFANGTSDRWAQMKRDERQIAEAIFKAIGYNIQKQRQLSGKTLLDLELGIGVMAETLTRYEKGDMTIPVIDLVKLAQFLSIPPGLLLNDLPGITKPAPKQDLLGFSEAHVEEFQQNFLKVTGPSRGKKFKKFIKGISHEDDDTSGGGTQH